MSRRALEARLGRVVKTGKHFVMRSGRAKITINQVADEKLPPRRAEFRRNYGLDNMTFLFPEWNEAARREKARRHILLLHGYQALTFAHLSYPHAQRQRLVYSTDNLMGLLHDVSDADVRTTEEGPVESPDPEALEDLAKFIRDNGL